MLLPIASISIGNRHRKEIGDISELCKSIEHVGLLHPVVIDASRSLISGARRIAAYKKLKRDSIETRVVSGLDDAVSAMSAERDENTCRKDFTVSEAVAIGKALEELERPRAKERQQIRKGNQHGDKSEKITELSNAGNTRDKVAAAIGLSGPTYYRAKAVVDAAEREPEKFKAVAEKMDRTGKIHPAYKQITNGHAPAIARPPKKFGTFENTLDSLKDIAEVCKLLDAIKEKKPKSNTAMQVLEQMRRVRKKVESIISSMEKEIRNV